MHRIRQFVLPVAALALILLVGSASQVHADRDDVRIEVKERNGQVHVITVDENGERHEETYDVDERRGSRSYLGVQIDEPRERGARGAEVEHVVSGSPAELAGLEQGDVIVRFDGEDVDSPRDLVRAVRASEAGQRVDVEILRDGRTEILTVETEQRSASRHFSFDLGDHLGEHIGEQLEEQMERLGEQLGNMQLNLRHFDDDGDHEHDSRSYHIRHRTSRPMLGVHLSQVTPELREHLGGPRDAGVLVSRVVPGTPADENDVRVGDLIVAIDGYDVEGHGDVTRRLRSAGGETIRVDVIRDGSPLTLNAFIPDPENEDDNDRRWERRRD